MDSDNNAVIKYINQIEDDIKNCKINGTPRELLADFAEKRTKEIETEDKAINENLRRFERRVFVALGESYYDEDKD